MTNDENILSIDMVNALLRAFVINVTQLPDDYVIIETRTRPRPYDDKPYVTLLWTANELLTQLDGDMEFVQPDPPEEEGEEIRNNTALCTVRITVRGDNAYNRTAEIRYAIDSANRSFDLWNVIGYAGVTNVTDLSAVYGGKVQQRSFIDLSFYAAFGRRYPLAWFSSVPWMINGINYIYPMEKKPCPKLP